MDRTKQIAWLKQQVGFHEGPNNENPYSRWQGLHNAPYCDSCAQEAAVEQGGYKWPAYCQYGVKGDAYTPYTMEHAQRLGMWRSKSAVPQVGWQVEFDWNGNGVADHIGTVIDVNSDGTFLTIEGNYHDQVMYVRRDKKYVLGFVALPVDESPERKPVVKVNSPMVAILTHPSWPTNSYIEVCSDGGVVDFGGAPFYGALPPLNLNKPVSCAAVTPTGQGYWLVAEDGGVFAKGDARPFPDNSLPGTSLNKPIKTVAATTSGNGLYLGAADGGTFTLGDASYQGNVQYSG